MKTKLSFKEEHHIGFYDDDGELWLVQYNDLVGTSIIEAIMSFQSQYCKKIKVGE